MNKESLRPCLTSTLRVRSGIVHPYAVIAHILAMMFQTVSATSSSGKEASMTT